MRKPPSHIGSPPPVTPKKDDTIITQIREYELITPLFGGGVNPGEVDPVTVIRGTAIRGQLRFWWRACRGGQANGDISKLREIEGKLWGAAAKKDERAKKDEKDQTVQISVNKISASKAELNSLPPYAAFPLQPLSAEDKEKAVRNNVSFELTISFPANQRKDVEAALWTWETFGGIGARTRRGFGALYCKSIKENNQSKAISLPEASPAKAQQWIVDNAKKHIIDGTRPSGVPHLAKNLVEGTHFKLVSFQSYEPITVWNRLVEKLKDFRQKRHTSTKPNAKHPGRSAWPEPSAIRQLTSQSHRDHRRPIPDPAIHKFPRAVFGLPIIFHFKDNGDPVDTTLQGAEKDHERLASPLILRPLICNGRKAIGLALILDGPRTPPRGLVLLKTGNPTPNPVVSTLTPNEAKRIAPLNGQTNVLQSFLDFLTTH